MIPYALSKFMCRAFGHRDVLIWPWFHCTRCYSSVRVPK
jgi:hypothetical protein